MGHSTGERHVALSRACPAVGVRDARALAGCQDIVAYLRDGQHASSISGGILQAPVSDRHYLDTLDDTTERLERAKTLLVRAFSRIPSLCTHSGVPTQQRSLSRRMGRRRQGSRMSSSRTKGGAHFRLSRLPRVPAASAGAGVSFSQAGPRFVCGLRAAVCAGATHRSPLTASTPSHRGKATMTSSRQTSPCAPPARPSRLRCAAPPLADCCGSLRSGCCSSGA